MKQAIAGVVPADVEEVKAMTVWPSISAYRLGRVLGTACAIRWPHVYIFRLGNLMALPSILPAILLYFWKVLPRVGIRYCLTNRRVVVQRGMKGVDERAIELDGFGSIEVDVLPGQSYYDAGDLVFKSDGTEKFRLAGVSRPEAFRQCCLKARAAFVGVKEVLEQQTAAV